MAGLPTIKNYPLPASGLPASIPNWSVDPNRAVLLIHDMQRYFLASFPEEVRGTLVRNAAQLRRYCDSVGIPVAYTAQPGGMNAAERGLLKDIWGPGMRVVPADREVVEAVAPVEGDWRFTKWRYSAFFRTDLLERMKLHGRDQLIICGVYAHVGVLMTAVDSFSNDMETFLVADAVADFSEEDHWLALEYAAKRCAVVTTTKAVTA